MRIVFLHDWDVNYEQELSWMDGLAAAMKELSDRGHAVTMLVCGEVENVIKHPYFDIYVCENPRKLIKQLKPDVILHWADMTRPNANRLADLGIPMAICFAGGEPLGDNFNLFDHVFCESQVYLNEFKKNQVPSSFAFGTNTNLFQPVEQQKVFDTLFPATFAAWKRHELYARATAGLNSIAVGYMYDDHEQECWQICLDNDVVVLPHVSATVLQRLYAASRLCVVPSMSSGGSQRTVLEAMAMNVPVIATDSDKFDWAEDKIWRVEPTVEGLKGYINALLDGDAEVDTRPFVLENYSHIQYADALERGLESIL